MFVIVSNLKMNSNYFIQCNNIDAIGSKYEIATQFPNMIHVVVRIVAIGIRDLQLPLPPGDALHRSVMLVKFY
jgi:hypothetical protein